MAGAVSRVGGDAAAGAAPGSPTGRIMHPADPRLCCDGAGYELPFRADSLGMALSCEESDDAARAHQR